ncbi:MAG: response regulator [Cyclobacteriaceae bacterium]|nr:response regulator [Cyclobacteriaceae bacterium]
MVDILLVDDSMEDAEMAIRALKKSNLANNLLHLEDGEAALNYFYGEDKDQTNIPKIILLDLKMPKVDGIEVLRRLKGDEKFSRIPVVVMTSSKEEKDIVETYRLGVNAYIVKPVDVEKFIKAVTDVGFFWLVMNEVPHDMR